ncbi:hypothetical protein GUITHDRAFT_111013 [Guillardia theta CCMP2712]|uniref:UBX domain-containing protein n=1 Tax=Guillardia theta (strain CCMP2712) TaxID=905079 RepID=L1J4A1_GUITC|nr:hypothetical protein GUITHDRAFT_111013 [Guillardia theta CCMP2712]EKX42964.1 hypothetical protein GUITHDRAFT_111013 [Guillardia theta CCMP2712]|eukprot:XP_005829944.1 hypothetical protein GUITHDRAFT_111013 [Guillardia theta CCMP2712]
MADSKEDPLRGVQRFSPSEARRNELMEIRRRNDEKLSQQKEKRRGDGGVVAGGGVLGGGAREVNLGRLHSARIRADQAEKDRQHALLCEEAKKKEKEKLEMKKQIQRMKSMKNEQLENKRNQDLSETVRAAWSSRDSAGKDLADEADSEELALQKALEESMKISSGERKATAPANRIKRCEWCDSILMQDWKTSCCAACSAIREDSIDAFSEQRSSPDDQRGTAPTSHEKAPAGTEADVDEDYELLEEPPTTADCIVVRFRLPSEKEITRRFRASDPLQALYSFLPTHGLDPIAHDVWLSYPRQVIPRVRDVAIQDLQGSAGGFKVHVVRK